MAKDIGVNMVIDYNELLDELLMILVLRMFKNMICCLAFLNDQELFIVFIIHT